MSLDGKTLLTVVTKNLIVTVCAVVSLVLVAVIYERSDLSDARHAELSQKSDDGKRYHANLINATRLPEDLQAVTDANRAVMERAIKPGDLAKNLQYFYRIEAETGVKLADLRQTGVASGARAAGSIYVPVGYTISAEGNFAQVITFLKTLEQGSHFYRLNNLMVSGTASRVTLNLNIDLLGQP